MQKIISSLSRFFKKVSLSISSLWKKFLALPRKRQLIIVVGVLVVLTAGGFLLGGNSSPDAGADAPTVTLSTLGELSGSSSGSTVIGSVRSVTEASILAQSGGTVRSVRTKVGNVVPAGFILATLENDSQAAQVLQAQGAYDSAVASRNILTLQSGNAQSAYLEAQSSARSTYRAAYTSLDTTMHSYVDLFFGVNTATGPQLLINPGNTQNLSQRRALLTLALNDWRMHLDAAASTDPATLLDEATRNNQAASDFLRELARAANDTNTTATATQLAALASARASVDAQLAALSAARDAYNAKKTAAEVGSVQSASNGTETASADALVKQALGALRGAQAVYEKTVIRAPISGTVNFLPIHVGDYVANFAHVATVAQNGALEIVASVSEDDRQNLAVGMHLTIEDNYDGVVTSVAPALDPITKQIEVHVAVTDTSVTDLVNGQSVRITLPNALVGAPTAQTATSTVASQAPLLIPLTTLKLTPTARIIFSVGDDGRLVAHSVEIGEVRGDRIEILTALPSDLRIVTDARGLSEGQKVLIATTIL